jgi:hypothetical protein
MTWDQSPVDVCFTSIRDVASAQKAVIARRLAERLNFDALPPFKIDP